MALQSRQSRVREDSGQASGTASNSRIYDGILTNSIMPLAGWLNSLTGEANYKLVGAGVPRSLLDWVF